MLPATQRLARRGPGAAQAQGRTHGAALLAPARPQRARRQAFRPAAALQVTPELAEAAAAVAPAPVVDVPDVVVPASPAPAAAAEAVTAGAANVAAGMSDKAAELASAANAATEQVTGAASKAASDLTAAVSGATSGVTSAVSGVTSGVTSAVSGAASGVTSAVSGLTSSLGAGASGVAGQVSGSLTSTLTTVKGGLGVAKGNLDAATAGVSSAVGGAVSSVTSTTQAAADAVNATLSSTQAAVAQTLDAVSAQAAAVTSQVSASVDATTQQVLGVLPEPVKDAAVAVGGAAAAAAGLAAEHPRAAAVLAAAVAVPSAINYYKGRYGGYAGELEAEQVAALLAEEGSVFLVDIRSEEQREQQGLPQLKLGARFKVAAFPMPQVDIPSSVARQVDDANELRLQVNAAYLAGLPQCQGSLTKVIIMDGAGGDKARALARALVSIGQPLSYTLAGGFAAWEAAELPVVEDASDYDASPGAVIGDELEVLADKAGEVAATVSRPSVGLPLLGGTALAGVAAANYHTTLQFIGVLGVLLTITNKALSYDNPKDALDDAVTTFKSAGDKLSALRSIKLPSLPARPGGGASSSSSSGAGGLSLSLPFGAALNGGRASARESEPAAPAGEEAAAAPAAATADASSEQQ